ncbi:putative GPI-anchored protein pfl2 [Eurytemora carolleeae]|uniref:putative GPI-anchored protein pfl2 n=1 Tax=Eurytemora carolleeae TaxID=1294199 RepID=UPI000C771E9A|nr:putative GPI-anchored protein pfl2 [Eurytemora carolleeae]|eukprot:XP_023342540.1 putative GPI-anchored protein pfl2 [Eurytemora affinis]
MWSGILKLALVVAVYCLHSTNGKDFGGIGDVEETKTLIRDVRASKITEEPAENKKSKNDSSVKARRRSERKRKNIKKKAKKAAKKKAAKKAAMKKIDKKGSQRVKKKRKVKQLDKEAKQAGTINEACVKDLATLAGLAANQARNYFQIAARALTADSAKKSKEEKKSVFKDPFSTLVSNLGGDSTNLTCGGKSSTDNTTVETVSVLEQCEQDIEQSCNSSLSEDDIAKIDACKTDTSDFRDLYITLLASQLSTKTGEELCLATQDPDLLALKDKVLNCSFLADKTGPAQSQVSERKACVKAFAACRSAERNSAGTISRCTYCPSLDQAAEELSALTRLNETLANSEKALDSAMEAAGVASGPGSDGTLPAGRIDVPRQAGDGPGCVEVYNGLVSFNKTASSADPNKPFNTGSSLKSAETLNAVTSRSTLVEDLTSCSSSRQTTIYIIFIRFYIFWSRWWRRFVVIVRIQIIKITINAATTALPATTTQAITSTSTTPTTSKQPTTSSTTTPTTTASTSTPTTTASTSTPTTTASTSTPTTTASTSTPTTTASTSTPTTTASTSTPTTTPTTTATIANSTTTTGSTSSTILSSTTSMLITFERPVLTKYPL